VPYLDYAASAPLRPEALAAMLPLLERPAANPSSQHGQGRAARAAVETAREQVAALIGAAPGDVVFTSGGTEADNLAVKGTVLARPPEARHLVCSAVEHHAVLDAAAWAEADAGARTDLAPVDRLGRVDPDRLAALLDPGRTALVAVMAANNEVGTGQPVAAVAELAHTAGAVLLCDAVQAAGLPGVDMTADGIDLLALASHKLGGPTGVGALVVRPGTSLRPLVHGGGQERGLRSGTLPAAALAGFGAAAAAALADRHTGTTTTTLSTLRSHLLAGLRALAPDLEINGDPGPEPGRAFNPDGSGDPRHVGRVAADQDAAGRRHPLTPAAGLPGLLSVRFPGRRAEDLLLLLDRHGVACSAGSACASGAVTPSHVLVAMGRDPVAARETVRFSLGHASTRADVDAAVTAVGQALEVLAPAEGSLDRRGSAPVGPGEGSEDGRRTAPGRPGPGSPDPHRVAAARPGVGG
jgi:cysteine desulfurase